LFKSKVIKADSHPQDIENFTFPTEEDYLQALAAEDRQRRETGSRIGVRKACSGNAAMDADEMSSEAENIISAAQQQAESIKSEAFSKGYTEGQQKALQEENAALCDVSGNFQRTLEELALIRERAIKENELEIIDLALDVARKIIGAELHNDPQTVAKVISKAISLLGVQEDLVVRVNPEDKVLLSKGTADFLSAVKLVSDPAIARGGAVIESSGGKLDAQIEEQLAEIEKSLKKGVIDADGAT